MPKRALFLGTVIFLSGCDDGRHPVRIGGHRFEVPKQYLDEWNIPWLPTPERDGLNVVMNPSDDPRDQVSVMVEPLTRVCGKQPTIFERPVCEGSFPWSDQNLGGLGTLRKITPEIDGGTQWYYVAIDPDTGKQVTVAACFGSDPDIPGLCHSAAPYGNLFVTVGYSEEKLGVLSKLLRHSQELLRAWEK
jgi:hypothetical protein